MSVVNQNWRKRNPAATKAHAAVNNAVRSGSLIRQPCRVCGTANAGAHHEDYSQPLQVDWLCNTCHRRLHTERSGQTVGGKVYQRKGWSHTHPNSDPKDVLLSEARRLRDEQISYRDIAKALGIAAGTVYKWLNHPAYK